MSDLESADWNSLNARLEEAGFAALSDLQISQFELYISLLMKWNARTNLTAVRTREAIMDRHIFECVFCAQILPSAWPSILDLGSGAGLPGIPIAICRPEFTVTLAESQNKKAAFLREAVRQIGLKAQVFSGRAETLKEVFDCITLRAVDRMQEAIEAATALLKPSGLVLVMTTEQNEREIRSISSVSWRESVRFPGSVHRIALWGLRT